MIKWISQKPLKQANIDYIRCLILAVGFIMLFLFLDWKPAQHDEGVNGWFIEEIISRGYYVYDPANYHGPLQHYLHFFFKIWFGSNLWALRLPAVLFSFATLYVLTLLSPYLGRFTAYTGALFVALSPGMLFYSRYAIHEASLCFFSVLSLLGFFRYWHEKDKTSLWFLGLGITGMLVAKETFILSVGCFVAALFLLHIYERYSPSLDAVVSPLPRFSAKDVLHVFSASVFIYVLVYSGFFMNWRGVFGVFACFADWFKTGVSTFSEQKGHWKPFLYWVQLFLRYEWPASLGFLFCFPLLAPAPRWHRLIMIYALLNFFVYSIIPYKTPWCILQLVWPFLFVSAAGFYGLAGRGGYLRKFVWILVGLLAVTSLAKSVSLNFFRYCDEKEPYVHVQTFEGVMEVHRKLLKLVESDPNLKHITIQVVMKAYWPISWLLLDFTGDAYYTENLPLLADADLIFCDADRQKRLEMRLKKPYFVQRFRLNSAQKETFVYYDTAVFRDLVSEKTAEVFRPVSVESPKAGEGLIARYYGNAQWSDAAVKEEIVGGVDFGWEDRDRPLPAPFGIVFEGEIFIPKDGETTFYLASDDGSDLWVAGERLIDHLGIHAEKIKSQSKFFKQGWYPVRIRHNDVGGGASIRLWWKLPGGDEQLINPRYFRIVTSEKNG